MLAANFLVNLPQLPGTNQSLNVPITFRRPSIVDRRRNAPKLLKKRLHTNISVSAMTGVSLEASTNNNALTSL